MLGGGGREEELLWKEEAEELVEDMRLFFIRGDSGGGGKLDISKRLCSSQQFFLQSDRLIESMMLVLIPFESKIDACDGTSCM